MTMRRDEMAIRNMMQMKQAGYDASLRDDEGYLHFDYREAPPPPPAPPGPGPEGGPAPGGPVQTSDWVLPPTFDEIIKRRESDPIHGAVPIPESQMTTMGTDLTPLRRQGYSQLGLHSRRSAGKSPDRVNRFSGEHRMSQTVQDRRDAEKSPSEKNADERLRNLDRRMGI